MGLAELDVRAHRDGLRRGIPRRQAARAPWITLGEIAVAANGRTATDGRGHGRARRAIVIDCAGLDRNRADISGNIETAGVAPDGGISGLLTKGLLAKGRLNPALAGFAIRPRMASGLALGPASGATVKRHTNLLVEGGDTRSSAPDRVSSGSRHKNVGPACPFSTCGHAASCNAFWNKVIC
ncbi:MAG: hypothetical protein ACRCVA_33730 [Phreatobacter sp.]